MNEQEAGDLLDSLSLELNTRENRELLTNSDDFLDGDRIKGLELLNTAKILNQDTFNKLVNAEYEIGDLVSGYAILQKDDLLQLDNCCALEPYMLGAVIKLHDSEILTQDNFSFITSGDANSLVNLLIILQGVELSTLENRRLVLNLSHEQQSYLADVLSELNNAGLLNQENFNALLAARDQLQVLALAFHAANQNEILNQENFNTLVAGLNGQLQFVANAMVAMNKMDILDQINFNLLIDNHRNSQYIVKALEVLKGRADLEYEDVVIEDQGQDFFDGIINVGDHVQSLSIAMELLEKIGIFDIKTFEALCAAGADAVFIASGYAALDDNEINPYLFDRLLAVYPHAEHALQLINTLGDAELLNISMCNALIAAGVNAPYMTAGLLRLNQNRILTHTNIQFLIAAGANALFASAAIKILIDSGINTPKNRAGLITAGEHMEVMAKGLKILDNNGVLDDENRQSLIEAEANAEERARDIIVGMAPPAYGGTVVRPAPLRMTFFAVDRTPAIGLNAKIIEAAQGLGIAVPDVPQNFICPFTAEIMNRPTENHASITPNRGEERVMQKIAQDTRIDPWTRHPMHLEDLRIDRDLASEIHGFVAEIVRRLRGMSGHEDDFQEFDEKSPDLKDSSDCAPPRSEGRGA